MQVQKKTKVRSKTISRKVGVGSKWRGELNRDRRCQKLSYWGSIEKKAKYLSQLKGTRQCFSRIRTPYAASAATTTEGRRTRLLAWREQLAEKGRGSGRLLMKRKKQDQKWILAKHLGELERSGSCDFEKPRKRVCQKNRLRLKLAEISWWNRRGTRVKSLEKVNSGNDYQKAWCVFFQAHPKWTEKEPDQGSTDHGGNQPGQERENGVTLHKEEWTGHNELK